MSGRKSATASVRHVSRLGFALASLLAVTRGPACAGDFAAFTWARSHPASTPHVSPLVHIDPWTSLEDAAATLKQLPPGKRQVIFQWITEDLADHPADRCLSRTWELRTRLVPVAPAAPAKAVAATAAARPVASSKSPASNSAAKAPSGLAKASAGRTAIALEPRPALVPVTERIAVDRPTEFRGPWMDNGIRAVRARVQALMARLKSLGAEIDGVTIDNETTLHAACFLGKPGALAAIEQDPRWPALAASLGLPSRVTGMSWGSTTYFQWTERMAARFDAAMNQAVYETIRATYPLASVSNYSSGRVLAEFATPDINGHLDRRATNGFGTHDNDEFYGWLADGRIAKAGGPASAGDLEWLAFRVEMHKIRGMIASSSRPKNAWIASKSWEGEQWGQVAIAGSPMWDELVLQLGMHGIHQFLELTVEDFSMTPAENLARRAADRSELESVLAELDRRASGADPAIMSAAQPSWGDRVIATGRRIGSKVVWRFSFAEGVDSARVAMSDGTTAVIAPEPGRMGAWFEHPATVQVLLDPVGRKPIIEVVESTSGGAGNSIAAR